MALNTPNSSPHILYVDDNVDEMEAVANYLRYGLKYNITSYSSGARMLDDLQSGKLKICNIDCIIMDFYLGANENTGLHYIREIYEGWDDTIAVIVFSGNADQLDVLNSFNYNVHKWIPKGPNLEIEQLAAAILSAVEETRHRREQLVIESQRSELLEANKKLKRVADAATIFNTLLSSVHHDTKNELMVFLSHLDSFHDIPNLPKEANDVIEQLTKTSIKISDSIRIAMESHRAYLKKNGNVSRLTFLFSTLSRYMSIDIEHKVEIIQPDHPATLAAPVFEVLSFLVNLVTNVAERSDKISVTSYLVDDGAADVDVRCTRNSITPDMTVSSQACCRIDVKCFGYAENGMLDITTDPILHFGGWLTAGQINGEFEFSIYIPLSPRTA